MVYSYMPANLPPEYFSAEKRFKQAATPAEKVLALEELLATVPKHKGTDKLRADLRARLSKLRDEAIRKKKTGKGDLYAVDREGALQIALVGFSNCGKSSLVKSLTNANPVIADYPMSTVMPLSGMMPFEDIQFQLVDLPPLGNESTDGWVSGILRNADFLMIVLDLSDDPDVQADLIIEQMRSWRIPLLKKNGSFTLPAANAKRTALVANKLDLPHTDEGLKKLQQRFGSEYPLIAVSAQTKFDLEGLKQLIFEVSAIIRIYAKQPGKDPDFSTPFALPRGATVLDLAEMIHKEFVTNMKYVCIWGSSRFPGQKVQRDYLLKDKDVVEFRV